MGLTNQDIAVELDNYLSVLDLQSLFQQEGPVEIEVGSGKGTFLVNQARAHADVNYLGIEWANQYYKHCVDRVRRWELGNVRVLRTDAREFIGRCLAPGSVRTLHVYFPDPWPKKRHHKRRFFTTSNIKLALRCLTDGGQLRAATDHQEYFEQIRAVLLAEREIAEQLEQIDFLPVDAADEGEWVGSNFERKYVKEGRAIYTLAVQKRPKAQEKR